jgi:hypothetical protein
VQVADSLSAKGFKDVYVFDKDDKKAGEASKKGYRLWDRKKGILFDLIIGCSGSNSFGIGDYVFLNDNAILASASSGSVELSREEFIELAASHDKDDIVLHREGLEETNIHSNLHFTLIDKKVTFLNGGFPINFDGRVNCMPAHYIQPTPVMMVEAARMTTGFLEKGEHTLTPAFSEWLDTEFRGNCKKNACFLIRKKLKLQGHLLLQINHKHYFLLQLQRNFLSCFCCFKNSIHYFQIFYSFFAINRHHRLFAFKDQFCHTIHLQCLMRNMRLR